MTYPTPPKTAPPRRRRLRPTILQRNFSETQKATAEARRLQAHARMLHEQNRRTELPVELDIKRQRIADPRVAFDDVLKSMKIGTRKHQGIIKGLIEKVQKMGDSEALSAIASIRIMELIFHPDARVALNAALGAVKLSSKMEGLTYAINPDDSEAGWSTQDEGRELETENDPGLVLSGDGGLGLQEALRAASPSGPGAPSAEPDGPPGDAEGDFQDYLRNNRPDREDTTGDRLEEAADLEATKD